MSLKNEGRNGASNVPLSYDRHPAVLERRASPSPGPSSAHNYYNNYDPQRAVPPGFRDSFGIDYAPDSWRLVPDPSYYARAPSPQRNAIPIPFLETWEQSTAPPAWSGTRNPWLDASQPRTRRDTMAERMFEPSDLWKQTHNDSANVPNGSERDRSFDRNAEPLVRNTRTRPSQRPVGDHYSPPHDRYSPSHTHYSPTRGHFSRDHYSPPRDHYSPSHDRYSNRDHYSPPHYVGDHHRPYSPPPAAPRYPYMNPRSDSYRPQYDDDKEAYSPYPSESYGSRYDDRDSEQRYASYSARSPSPFAYSDRRYVSPDRSPSPTSRRYYSNASPGPSRSDHDRGSPRSARSLSSRSYTPYRRSSTRPLRDSPGPRRSLSPRRSRSRSYTPPSTFSSRAPFSEPRRSPAAELSHAPSVNPVLQVNVDDDLPDYDSLASTPHEEKPMVFPPVETAPSAPPMKPDVPLPTITDPRPDVVSGGEENVSSPGQDAHATKVSIVLPATDLLASAQEVASVRTKNTTPILQEVPSSPRQDSAVGAVNSDCVGHAMPARSPKVLLSATESVDGSDMEMSEPPTPASDSHQELTADLPDYAEDESNLPDAQPPDVPPETPPQTRTPSSRQSVTDDSDMDMSPPPSPTKRLPPLESDGMPGAELHSRTIPYYTAPPTPSRSQLLLSKLEKLQTASPPILRGATSSRSPEHAGEHPNDNRGTPSEDESDMDMSPPASPTVHSLSVGSATAVPFDTPDVPVRASAPPSLEDVPEPGTMAQSDDPHNFDEPQKPSLAETIVVEIVAPPTGDAAAVSPPSPVATMPETAELKPSLHDAAPLSLTIIPVAYQDQSHLRNSIDDAEPTVVEPPSDVPLATADVMHQTGDRIPESLSLPEALRMIVITRIRCDRQTRDERINPVLYANRATVEIPHTQSSLSCQELLQDIFAGERGQSMQDAHERLKPSLAIRFSQRQAILTEKVQILRAEYLALHERWLAHCAKLDDVAKAHALEEAAATAGRTTRRSAALGDAVRSDLEMEQIIASLGNEELTDANHLSARNAAGIPDMVSVTRGTVDYLYDDTNNVVDAPLEFYAHRTGIDDWTNEEKDIFLAQFALHPKQFGIIADSLPHKTAAQCVVYYYLHKKTFINFRKVVNRQANGKRKRGGRRTDKGKGNALLTDIRRHDDEMSRGSTPSGATTRRKRANPTANTEPRKTRKTVARIEESPISTPTPDPEPEPRRRRRRPIPTARAVASVEQEADVPPVEVEHKPARKGRRGRKIKSSELVNSPIGEEPPVLVHETRFIDQTELISRKKSASGSVAWSAEDKSLFLRLLGQHGDDFKRIAASMPNKTTIQVSTFYKHHLAELDLEKVAASAPKRSPTPDSTPDIWKEASFPGSGVITPNTSSSTPAEGIQPPLTGLGLETRFKFSEHVAPAFQRSQMQDMFSSEREPRSSSMPADQFGASSSGFQFRSTTVDAIRAQYSGLSEPPLRTFPILSQSSNYVGSQSGLYGSTGSTPATYESAPSSSTSAPLTMTFPSNFAYSNLSPSHFTGDIRPSQRSTTFRDVSPPGTLSSSTMTFDASMFPQQPWIPQSSLHNKPALPTPGLPATLQTTEDLRAYLEHQMG